MSNLYLTSLSGLRAQQLRLDAVANNIANLGTTGFKTQRIDLTDLRAAPLQVARAGSPPAEATEIQEGVAAAGTTRIFSQGPLQVTESPLDLAILGDDAFFQVRRPDGTIAYTRDGHLSIDGAGQVVSVAGPLEPPITLPAGAKVSHVSGDGTVYATLPGSTDPVAVGQLQLARFPNPGGLAAAGENLFVPTAAAGAVTVGTPGQGGMPQVGSGVLESSNVDLAEQTTTMIEAQRAYSMNLRAVQALDEMIGLAVQLKS